MRISDWSSDVCSSDLVATIESREAATISGDLRAAQARAAQAKANYERERTLYEAKVTARADLEAARADYEAAAAQAAGASGAAEAAGVSRSEEHTAELQSLLRISYAVCCLKKKKP